MDKKYKLTSFNIKSLGEPIKYLLNLGNIEYEEVQIAFEDWPKIKPTMPFQILPILEVDGHVLFQTFAICRYLAKMLSLNGSNAEEELEIDMVVEAIGDLKNYMRGVGQEKDPQKRDELMKTLATEHIPYYFERLEKIAIQNGGYFVNGKLSLADIIFASVCPQMEERLNVNTDNYPTLQGIVKKVEDVPQIKAYLQRSA